MNLDARIDWGQISFYEGLQRLGVSYEEVMSLVSPKTLKDLDIDIPDVINQFLEERISVKLDEKFADLTVYTYKSVLIRFESFCAAQGKRTLPLIELPTYTSEFLNYAQSEFALSIATRNKYNSTIRSLANFVLKLSSMHDELEMPKLSNKRTLLPRALSLPQVKNLLEIAKQSRYGIRCYFLIVFLLGTGLRRNEFCQLTLEDINFSKGEVTVRHGKGNSKRIIPVRKEVLEITKLYLDVYNVRSLSSYLYFKEGSPDCPVTCGELSRVGRNLLSKLAEYNSEDPIRKYSLHTLRHSYATIHLLGGTQIRVIQQLLGHSKVTTTEIYTQLDVEGLRIAGANGLNGFIELLQPNMNIKGE